MILLIYRVVKAIGRFFVKYYSFGMIIAVILSIVNSFFVDISNGKITLNLAGSLGAIINYALLIFIIFFWIAQVYGEAKESIEASEAQRQRMDDFCEQTFITLELDSSYRISVFEECGGKLKITGRFAQFDCESDTKVEFKSNMGCVGIAYYTGSMNVIDNLPIFDNDPDEYYRIMKEEGNMDEVDVDRLSRKNRSYLSYPIKYFNSQKIAAVLCIDCTEQQKFSDNSQLIREINTNISSFVSFLFKN